MFLRLLRLITFFLLSWCSQIHAETHTTGSLFLDSTLNLLFSLNIYSNESATRVPSSVGVEFCEQWNDKLKCKSSLKDYTLAEGICRAFNKPEKWLLNCSSALKDYTLSEGICRAFNKDKWVSNCNSPLKDYTLAEGICRAGNQDKWISNCSSPLKDYSIAEGICRAGNRDKWLTICVKFGKELSVDEAIQLLPTFQKDGSIGESGQFSPAAPDEARDFEWDWDAFYNKEGNLVWACRGVQSGQFADLQNCRHQLQLDWRWPNK